MIVGRRGAAVLLVIVNDDGRREPEMAELAELVDYGYEVTHMTSQPHEDRYLLRAAMSLEAPQIAPPVDRMS